MLTNNVKMWFSYPFLHSSSQDCYHGAWKLIFSYLELIWSHLIVELFLWFSRSLPVLSVPLYFWALTSCSLLFLGLCCCFTINKSLSVFMAWEKYALSFLMRQYLTKRWKCFVMTNILMKDNVQGHLWFSSPNTPTAYWESKDKNACHHFRRLTLVRMNLWYYYTFFSNYQKYPVG